MLKVDDDDSEVPRIQKLHEDVVNRIAAGEVIQRPANAVKEMLENSLDAGSTSITVTCKQGGLKILQIQDNGHGIKKEDLKIVCERFTTSKLRKFEDLRQIATFGFRGEALASITHVARVTITSKTKDSPCAFKTHYSDGKPVALKPGASAEPQPCAGVNGTIILAEDLFYNMPTRKRAFGTGSEQYARVLDVMTRYAIHFGNRGVSFTCKKHGQPASDLHTPQNSSTLQNITVAYGQTLSRELIELKCGENEENLNSNENEEHSLEESLAFRAHGYISNANYSAKKSAFILFINNRLVDCPGVRKTVEGAYADILPRGTKPFVYLSLTLPAYHLDVNVHPTKQEVHFMHEEHLLQRLVTAVETCLRGANKSRTFYSQAVLPSSFASSSSSLQSKTSNKSILSKGSSIANAEKENEHPSNGKGLSPEKKQPKKAYVNPTKFVRTDSSSRNIHDFFTSFSSQHDKEKSSQDGEGKAAKKRDAEEISHPHDLNQDDFTEPKPSSSDDDAFETPKSSTPSNLKSSQGDSMVLESQSSLRSTASARKRPRTFKETTCSYYSIKSLLHDIKDNCHKDLQASLARHTFVGIATQTHSLVQYETKLLLVNHYELSKEMFYQLAIRRFECTQPLKLTNPVPCDQYVRAALDLPDSQWQEEDGDKDQLTKDIIALLAEKSSMIKEYFNIDINEDLQLVGLPELLEGHKPLPSALPSFLLRLVTEVDWTEEEGCFEGIASELAMLYATLEEAADPPKGESQAGVEETKGSAESDATLNGPGPISESVGESASEVIRHLLFPAFRWALLPPREFATNGIVAEVAALEKLYKVFERC